MTVRRAQLEGREHFVVPMVMLQEGVFAGSDGPALYTQNELARSARRWSSMPIVVDHPLLNGEGVSAADPAVFNAYKVGHVFNARMEGTKLVAEAWIDKARLLTVNRTLHDRIAVGDVPIEVSTGLFSESIHEVGTFDGVEYHLRVEFIVPDHLAILTSGVGACGIRDRCGLGVVA